MADAAEDDILLTAWLDGELAADVREAVARRLTDEPELRLRLEDLQRGGANLQAAFAAAMGAAPKANLLTKAGLNGSARIATEFRGHRALAAAIAFIAFIIGAAASRLLTPAAPPEEESWRQSVAEYMELYTAATFAPMDEPSLTNVLSGLSENVGVELSRASLRSGDLAPRVGFPLQFKGAPLVEIGYVADGAPAAFCVIRDGETDAQPKRERRGAFNTVSWAKSGRGFLVISAAPADRVEALARSLQDQVALR